MADPKGKLVTPVAFRSDGSLHALELDDNDHLKASFDSQPISSTRWALLWGYSEPWRESIQVAAVDAGDAIATSAGVDAGYVYVLQSMSFFHDAGVDKDGYVYIYDGSVTVVIFDATTLTTGVSKSWTGEIVLAEDDTVSARVYTPGDTKFVRLNLWGYKMKIAE